MPLYIIALPIPAANARLSGAGCAFVSADVLPSCSVARKAERVGEGVVDGPAGILPSEDKPPVALF
jgi:hypothetical protein